MWTLYNFVCIMEYYSSSDFFQPPKTILSLWDVPKQTEGGICFVAIVLWLQDSLWSGVDLGLVDTKPLPSRGALFKTRNAEFHAEWGSCFGRDPCRQEVLNIESPGKPGQCAPPTNRMVLLHRPRPGWSVASDQGPTKRAFLSTDTKAPVDGLN